MRPRGARVDQSSRSDRAVPSNGVRSSPARRPGSDPLPCGPATPVRGHTKKYKVFGVLVESVI